MGTTLLMAVLACGVTPGQAPLPPQAPYVIDDTPRTPDEPKERPTKQVTIYRTVRYSDGTTRQAPQTVTVYTDVIADQPTKKPCANPKCDCQRGGEACKCKGGECAEDIPIGQPPQSASPAAYPSQGYARVVTFHPPPLIGSGFGSPMPMAGWGVPMGGGMPAFGGGCAPGG